MTSKFKIHIADTGCGIKSGEVDKLFQSYSRLSNANTKEGFGIGLSSCQDLARVNNSIITFQPNRESSSGSVFTLEIPSEYILQYQNTLLVDDEELVIKSNIRSLKNISKEINSSMSLTQALEQIKNKKYDLVISDYNLSCDKAWPIIEHAKAKNPLVKIIILSGEEIKELNDRNVRFLLKPAKRKDIINTLAEMEWG